MRKWQTVEPTSTVRFNMEVAHLQRMIVSVSCSSRAIAHSVIVPILTNTVALRKGDQLCLEVVTKAVATKRKVSDWKTDALKSKAAHHPSPPPQPQLRMRHGGTMARKVERTREA